MSSKQRLKSTSIKHVFVTSALSALSALLLLSMKANSNETTSLPKLTIKPNQCVSLHQGQKCSVSVDISWQVNKAGDYCLYSSVQGKKLNCWFMKKSGNFKQALVIDKDVTFTLNSMDNNAENGEVIASAVLELAWVHKKSRLSHSAWRVF